MKCRICDTEMYIDRVQIEQDSEIFRYKCPNKDCENYGYNKDEK